ncbi:Cytochrome P450 [Sergentomyia squamirostris]
MLLVICSICVFVFILHHFWTYRELYKLSWIMPGPLWVPFIGNAYSIIGRTHEGLLDLLNYLATSYPMPLRRYWFGPNKLYILITKPEDIQTVLNAPECLNRDGVYKYVSTLAGNGLVCLPADTWKEHRKYLNPTFSLKILQSYMQIFNKETNTLTDRLKQYTGKPAFDIYELMDACTLDIVCQTTMGTEMNIQKNQNVNYLKAANNLLSIMTTRIFNPLMHLDTLFRLTKWYNIEKKSMEIVFGFVDKILQRKKAEYHLIQKKLKEVEKDENVSMKTPLIYIDQLLKLSMEGGIFRDEDVINEANTIISTGFESSALITSYCVLMLAMHPDIQAKVYEEIGAVISDPNDIKYDELGNLKYTERVIKETMRLFPTVPAIARVANAPFQLREYTIPAKTHFAIGIVTLHRDKTVWGPKAEEFDPDHFLPEKFEKIHPYAYVPFSAGPRNCIGIKYAYMLMKVLVVHLVSSYKFTTDLRLCDLKHRVDITLKLSNKHMVSIEART